MDSLRDSIRSNIDQAAEATATGFINGSTVIASVQDILKDAYEENYIVIGILYKILHANHDKTDMTTFYSPKKQKKNYNRMFMFGSFDGTCFCVIAENENRAKAMMNFCSGNSIGVGQPFVLVEPKQVPRQYLRKDMPVLEISLPFLPLQTNIIPLLSQQEIRSPNQAEETTFFFLHNVEARFVSCEIRGKGDVEPPSCSGLLCDRKEAEKICHACGCFNNPILGNVSPVVLEYSLVFKADGAPFEPVKKERSFRTTLLFISSAETLGVLQQIDRNVQSWRLRECVKKCNDYVNAHGGFTLGGTVSRGLVHDISDPNARVLNESSTFHICYAMPTDPKVEMKPEYRALKYTYEKTSTASPTGTTASPPGRGSA
jgi:hypothetical protein